MKRKIKLLLILSMLHQFGFCQKVNFEATKLIVTNQVDDNALLMNFNKAVKFQYGKNIVLDKNSPEEIFYNFFNINSNEQLKVFFDNKIPVTYSKNDYLNLMNVYKEKPEKNFYELDFKILFKDGNNQYSYIKYINHNELFPKPIASIIYLELINDKWIIKDLGDNLELGIFLSSIKGNKLEQIILRKQSQLDNKIIQPYITNDKIDFNRLMNDFYDLKKKNINHPLVQLIYDNEFSIF
ncbi:hypothetical protein [Flavobacterium sp. T12S277]|uniref:hypothetical protein n=1 Tax=Flavobacterium sp. T12S277 TaxID=3402752 RepID=UPI003ADB6E4A